MDELQALKSLDEAMCNSYDVIVGNATLEELMVNTGGEGVVFAHNIELPPTNNDIESLLTYFKDQQDFERCIELSKLNDS